MSARIFDVAVVGAGPAGLAAATTAARLSLGVVVLDDQPSPGGQIHRAITTTPLRRPELLGPDYWRGSALLRPFQSSGAHYLPGAGVWLIDRRADGVFDLGVTAGRPTARLGTQLSARAIVLATGAMERPFPIEGWTLPGVIAVGGAQNLFKSAALVPRGSVVIAGCGPLLWAAAAQYVAAGVDIAALLETVPRGRLAEAMRHAPGFMFSSYLAHGLDLVRRVRRRVRVVEHVTALAAHGDARVREVRYAVDGALSTLPVDVLLLHQGVVPNLELPAALSCELRWNTQQACFEPVTDAWGGTSVEGVFVAGDGAGIAGASAAEARGHLAALGVANALGRIDGARRETLAATHRAALTHAVRGRAFLDALYRPPDVFRLPVGEHIVCRCEEVTAAAVRAAVREGAHGPNQLKAYLRCGMGACQGRQCGLTISELIASERKVSPAEVGHFNIRFPTKAVTLGEVAAWPSTPAAERAVERWSQA